MARPRGRKTSSHEIDRDGMEKVTRVTDHVFTSPRPYKTLLMVIVVSLLLGMMFEGLSSLTSVLRTAVVVFMVPGLLAALLAVPITNGLGGRLYLRRSMLMVFLCQGIMVAIWVVWAIVDLFASIVFKPMALLILTFPFFIWHTVLVATSDRRHARTVWASGLQPVLGLVGFHQLHPLTAGELMFGVAIMVTIVLAVLVFTNIARAPISRNYGYDGLDLVKHMLAHWTEGITEGILGMEDFFDSFSVKANIPLGLVAFRPVDSKKVKGLVVVPGAHPGPFGHLAGSNLPGKVGPILGCESKGGPFVMVPHSASTHDMNPATTDQAIKIGAVARKILKEVEYRREASRSSRIEDGSSIAYQPLGDSLFVVHDPSSKPRDDLDEVIGKDIVKHAKREGIDHTLFIDAHNAIKRGSESVYHHSPEAEKIIEMAETAIERSKVSKREHFRVGYADDREFTVEGDGIGPAGIQVMVVEVETHRTAYVLIDGNNIVHGLTKDIMKALHPKVKETVVMTTDNHVANVTMGGFNPIGTKGDDHELILRIEKLVQKAVDDLEECEAGGASGTVSLKVFGPGATARLTATINSTMSVMKLGITAALALTFTGTLVWYQFLSFLGLV